MLPTETIDEQRHDEILSYANTGSYTRNVVSLLTADLDETDTAQDASYMVVENAYTSTIFRLDDEGRPVAILERD